MNPIEPQQVLQALATIQDPDLGVDIVQAGFVKELQIEGGRVAFTLELTTPACPLKARFKAQAEEAVGALPGVESVAVTMSARVKGGAERSGPVLPGVGQVVAVASGKGGVGKSTVAVNLAAALHATGARVGVMDIDVYGPSAQIMFGLPPGTRPEVNAEQQLVPIEVRGMKVMSMAFLAAADTPVVWRGPMVAKLVKDFLEHVEWGELDYLVVDLPPGTGDAQLTLCQTAPLSGAVIVTTPQDVSLVDARKGLELFRQVKVPVLGIVENMSWFSCPHCGGRTEVFGHGGGRRIGERLAVPLLGEIPLEAGVAASGDAGVPIVLQEPEGVVGRAYADLAGEVARQLSILAAGAGTARLALDWAEAPVEEPDALPGSGEGDAKVLIRVYKAAGDRFGLLWGDGSCSQLPVRPLRLACPCAVCVDEFTGDRILKPEEVPADVVPVTVEPVGAYALRIAWSDGHGTGLYSFDLLAGLGRE